jgi:alcohol dehydrogenase, propanol-preferring
MSLQPLSSINKVFDRLKHGDVPSRVVFDFIGTKEDDHKSKIPAAKKMEAAAVS